MAPFGYMFGTPTISPGEVVVHGRQETLDRIGTVTADVTVPEDDPGLNSPPITGDFDVVARDKDGHSVDGVSITPAQAHVNVPLVRAASTKIVPIAPTLTGSPGTASRIASASVSPAFVTLSGTPEALAQATVVMTDPVDIAGATREVKRSVQLLIPKDVTAVGGNSAIVDVKIERIAPSATPTPLAAPAKPGTPAAHASSAPAHQPV
jgi:YbbR domain-containing protein